MSTNERLENTRLKLLKLLFFDIYLRNIDIFRRMIHMKSMETYDNTHQWDVLFVVTVWIGFFPVITDPALMLCMIMSK